MAHIEGQIVINCPIEDVFDIVADRRNEPSYNPIMAAVEQVTLGPIGIGTQFEAVTKSMGQTVEMISDITGFDRPYRINLKTHFDAMDIQGVQTFERVPEGTRMCWSWEITPHGFYRLMEPVIARLGNAQEEKLWAGLKRFVEAHAASKPIGSVLLTREKRD
jgi:uncharacterized membrane protein